MADLTNDQAEQLYNSGAITEDTLNMFKQKLQTGDPIADSKPTVEPVNTTTPVEQMTAEDLDQVEANLIDQQNQPLPDDVALAAQMPTAAPDMSQVPLEQQTPAMEGIENAYTMKQIAAGTAAEAGMEKAEKEAEFRKEFQQQMEEFNQRQQVAEQERQEQLVDQLEKIDATAKEYGSLEIDPSRLYKNASTGQKILASIGLVLGSFGRNGNQAASTIMKAVNQDINAQKADIATAKGELTTQQGVLSQMRQLFGDERQAEQAAKLAMLENAENKIKQFQAESQSKVVQAQGQDALAGIELEKQKLKAKAEQAAREAQTRQYATQTMDPAYMSQEQKDVFVPGYGFAFNKENAEKFKDEIIGIESSLKGIDELLDLAKSGATLSPDSRGATKVKQSLLIGELRLPVVGPGALSDQEMDLLRSVIADPSKFTTISEQAKLKALRESIARKRDIQAKFRIMNYQSPEQKKQSLGAGAPVKAGM